MYGAINEARLVIRVHCGSGDHADSRHPGEGQGSDPVQCHQSCFTDSVQSGPCTAELQMSCSDT